MMGTNPTYLNRTTPGVYITEIDAFGASVVGVPTAVPVFIGYTEYAGDPATGTALYDTPVAITSMAAYLSYFGGPAQQRYAVAPIPPGGVQTPDFDASFTTGTTVAVTGFSLNAATQHSFSLYWQMQLFFANGGSDCSVVSVGSYWAGARPTAPVVTPADGQPATIVAAELIAGLTAAGRAQGPTMIVIPEACQLDLADYGSVAVAMLDQAGRLQDRVAILDLPNALGDDTIACLTASQAAFANAVAPAAASFSFGAAYAPTLQTSIVSLNDIFYTWLVAADGDNAVVNNILTTQAWQIYGPTSAGETSSSQLETVQTAIASAFPLAHATGANDRKYSGSASPYPPPGPTEPVVQWQTTLDNLLCTALPILEQIKQQIADRLNVQPPSAMLAGVWARNDELNGVWNAPANMALASVTAPLYTMTDAEHAGFAMPTAGPAINVVRAMVNRGTMVWGAHTLDGANDDYRYIQVRRTQIYIAESIKLALQAYVFAANDATTWSAVTAAISAFLTGLWQQGGLMGATSSDAFTVHCGRAATTTGDVMGNHMIVTVTVQMLHPGEFLELTFAQMMAG